MLSTREARDDSMVRPGIHMAFEGGICTEQTLLPAPALVMERPKARSVPCHFGTSTAVQRTRVWRRLQTNPSFSRVSVEQSDAVKV